MSHPLHHQYKGKPVGMSNSMARGRPSSTTIPRTPNQHWKNQPSPERGRSSRRVEKSNEKETRNKISQMIRGLDEAQVSRSRRPLTDQQLQNFQNEPNLLPQEERQRVGQPP